MDYQALATQFGQENNDKFKADVDAAVDTLSTLFGYPLVATDSSATPRYFTYDQYAIWHRVDPFYSLTSVEIEDFDGTASAVTDTQTGLNGDRNATWFNGIRLCSCFNACGCASRRGCRSLKVTANWGFAAPSGTPATTTLPSDLTLLLKALMDDSNDSKRGIKSESRGTTSYTKFDNEPVTTRYAYLFKKYSNRGF